MNRYLEQLKKLLPRQWPTKANSDPAWWAEHGSKIKAEDLYCQAELDLLLERNPILTGSEKTIRTTGTPAGVRAASLNHKKARDTVIHLRDGNPRPFVALLAGEANQFMQQELFSGYIRFHARSAAVNLYHARERGDSNTVRLCQDWMAKAWWWLEDTAFPEPKDGKPWVGKIISEGLRTHSTAPAELNAELYRVYRGDPIDTSRKNRKLGYAPAWKMNGGMPQACDVWITLACRDEGLLEGLMPERPLTLLNFVHDRESDGILSYFPAIEYRPGQDDILVAAEYRNSAYTSWWVGRKQPIPAARWGFSPVRRKVISREED